MDKTKKAVNQWLYEHAGEHADVILEAIYPKLKEALREAYTRGINDGIAMTLKHNKNGN